jgi:hypothetical protein
MHTIINSGVDISIPQNDRKWDFDVYLVACAGTYEMWAVSFKSNLKNAKP